MIGLYIRSISPQLLQYVICLRYHYVTVLVLRCKVSVNISVFLVAPELKKWYRKKFSYVLVVESGMVLIFLVSTQSEKNHQYSSVCVRVCSFLLASKCVSMKVLDYHLLIVLGMLPSGARQTRRRRRRPATGTAMIVVLSAHSSATPTFIYPLDYLSSPYQHLYPQ